MIKFFNLYKQDKKLHNHFLSDIKKLLKKSDFINGKKVNEFELKFSKFCKSKHAISCGNGTDALTIALKSLNLPNNSEVIIPAMTYCSTAFSIINANLIPILVDIDHLSPTISLDKIKKKINKNTKVIMPVHLYGSVVSIKNIKKIIKKKKIIIIDDCSQAHGASNDNNSMVGSIADISCFSLYPGKNLGAYGDAGIITTNKKKYFKIIKKIRNLGSDKKFVHDRVGVNSRLDTIQALILIRKLNELKKNNKKRIKIASLYSKLIVSKNIKKLTYSKNAIFHQYVIIVKNRLKLIKLFKQNKIQYGFHYPKSINQLNVFKNKFKNQKFPNAEKIAKFGISIPIDPNLSKGAVYKIVKLINSV